MEFRTLGPLEVGHGDRPVPLSTGAQRAILAALLVRPRQPVTTERLIDVVWPSSPPPSARASLHSHVSRLRRVGRAAGGEEWAATLRNCRGGYVLDVDDEQIDVTRFERLVTEGRASLARHEGASASRFLEAALGLWRGRPFDEIADHDVAMAEVARLEALRLDAAEDWADARLAVGDHAEALPELEAAVAEHPLRERRQAQLMVALHRCGRVPDALAAYQSYRRRLVDELGLDPSRALQELERDILRREPRLDVTAGHDIGHDDGRPPQRAELPVEVTRLVGREEHAAAVEELLRRCRVVTLTGVGGVGKTRLAEHVARGVRSRYPGGVRLCELAGVGAEADVEQALAETLGVRRQRGRRAGDAVADALQGGPTLLFIDNCEHVVTAAGTLIARLVRACRSLTVLATSRERLAVPGEHVFAVPPLPHEADGRPGSEPAAVELLRDRIGAVNPRLAAEVDPAIAVELCRRLDGIPLAIELAGARANAVPPAELLARLDDRFRILTAGPRSHDGRHRTLRDVVDWSYSLLGQRHARAFERLSVFAGGFTLEAAGAVCAGGGVEQADVADLVADLVDRSLVVLDRTQPPARYRLLETLREYAAARLAERNETAQFRSRHAAALVALAEHADRQMRGPDQARSVAALSEDLDNLRAAHGWLCERGDVDLALRLSAALHFYAEYRLADEVFDWGVRALRLPGAGTHPLAPLVCGSVARGISNRGELAEARSLAEAGLAAAPDRDDPRRALCLHALSAVRLYEGRLHDCIRLADEEAELARRSGDDVREVLALLHRALAHAYSGDSSRAISTIHQLRRLADETAVPDAIAWALYAHGEALLDDDPAQASDLLRRSVDVARTVRNRFAEGVALASLTSLQARRGDTTDALRQFRDVIEHWRRTGDWTHQWTVMRSLVQLLARLGRHEAAATLHGAVTASLTAAPIYGADQERLEAAAHDLSDHLSHDRFTAEARAGAELPGDAVVTAALREIEEALEAVGG